MGEDRFVSSFEMLVVASGEDPRTEARRIELLIARQIDGLLVVAAQDEFGSTPGFPMRLPRRFSSTALADHPDFDTVCSNNLNAAYRGTRHLLELGHKDVTLLISSANHAHLRDRVEGYRRALGEFGLSAFERISFGGGTIEGAEPPSSKTSAAPILRPRYLPRRFTRRSARSRRSMRWTWRFPRRFHCSGSSTRSG